MPIINASAGNHAVGIVQPAEKNAASYGVAIQAVETQITLIEQEHDDIVDRNELLRSRIVALGNQGADVGQTELDTNQTESENLRQILEILRKTKDDLVRRCTELEKEESRADSTAFGGTISTQGPASTRSSES